MDDQTLQENYTDISKALNKASNFMSLRGDEAKNKVTKLRELLNSWRNSATKVLVCGEFKRGKSTTINALIGRELCPTAAEICTSVVSVISYGERENVTRIYGSLKEPKRQTISIRGLDRYTALSADTFDDTIAIEIKLPLESLKNGLVIVDTPGVGGLNPRHAALTNMFLPQADVTLFMTAVGEPLTEAELDFYKTKVLPYAHRSAVIVNKADLLMSEDEVNTICADTRSKIVRGTNAKPSEVNVLAVSALNSEDTELGNFDALRSLIEKLVISHKADQLRSIAAQLVDCISFYANTAKAQRDQIQSPDPNKLQQLQEQVNELQKRIDSINNPESEISRKIKESIEGQLNYIREYYLNGACLMLQGSHFETLLRDNRAMEDNGSQWFCDQLNQCLENIHSEIELRMVEAFKAVASMPELNGMLNVSIPDYNDAIELSEIDNGVPLHRYLQSGTAGFGVGSVLSFVMGFGVIPLVAGAFMAYSNYQDIRRSTATANLRTAYYSQLCIAINGLKAYVENAFNQFRTELTRVVKEQITSLQNTLKETINEINQVKSGIKSAVAQTNILNKEIAELNSAMSLIQNSSILPNLKGSCPST